MTSLHLGLHNACMLCFITFLPGLVVISPCSAAEVLALVQTVYVPLVSLCKSYFYPVNTNILCRVCLSCTVTIAMQSCANVADIAAYDKR